MSEAYNEETPQEEKLPLKRKGPHLLISLALVVVGALLPYLFFEGGAWDLGGESQEAGVVALSWKDLQRYDYKKNHLPDDVREKISHPVVQLAGFAVPLQASSSSLDHFLFVPSQAYCVHVPPPPPHLMIEVKMKKKQAISTKALRGALVITGQLKLTQRKTAYGQASWYFHGDRLQPYRPPS